MEILPDYAGQSGVYDPRSQAEKMVAALETALLAGAAAGALVEYSISGRVVKKDQAQARQELTYWKSVVSAERRRERIKRGLSTNRIIKTRFSS